MNNAIHSLKIDSLPEKYSQISTFLSYLVMYYGPNCNDPMEIPSSESSILNEAVQQEIERLYTTVALNHGRKKESPRHPGLSTKVRR